MKTRLGQLKTTPTPRFDISAFENPLRPEWFQGISEARLGKLTGLSQFGVNLVRLEPGSASSLRHWHEGEDEFVLVLSGSPTLIDESGEQQLAEGSYVGFPAGEANGHHFFNHSSESVELLVIGSRKPGEDTCHYPDDNLGPIPR